MSRQQLSARVRRHALDLLICVLAVASIVEIFVAHDLSHRLGVVPFALCWSLPFLARRRFPFGAPLVAAVALAAMSFVLPHAILRLTLPFLAAIAAAVAFGSNVDRRRGIAGWAALMTAATLVDYRAGDAYSDLFWTLMIFSLAWFFGLALATRTEQTRELRERVRAAELERAHAAEHAAIDERARIARELHDVVAHSVSVMVVQSSGVRRLLRDDQAREREALLSVEQIGRQALAEMRRMLGVMRAGEERTAALTPQPGLEHLDGLIEQIEEAGLPVALHVEGERSALSPGVDLSAYRIVQEGLTNALKHAKGAHRADVFVRYAGNAVEVEIADDGPGLANGDATGHGLAGMRERVALYGGTLEAGPRPEGGFALRARLPVEGART